MTTSIDTTYGFNVETEEAKKFWASKHKCNKMKAIIAFSKDWNDANNNLRRYGYTRAWRERAIFNFWDCLNRPDMKDIYFSELKDLWWEEMPYEPEPFPYKTKTKQT